MSERTCGGRGLKRYYTKQDQSCSVLSGVGVANMCPCAADQGTGICAFITPADAHHMGSCGHQAFVGGLAPAGMGLCCNHSGPWRPAAAVGEPVA